MYVPYICMDLAQLNANPKDLEKALRASANQALDKLEPKNIKAMSEASKNELLLVIAAELLYIGQRLGDQHTSMKAREAIRAVKAADDSMPDEVIDMFDAEDVMPESDSDRMTEAVTVDRTKADVDQTWATIQTYVNKIKDAIKKLNERVNKQLHENLRTFMKSGKVTAASKKANISDKKDKMQKALPRKKARKKAARVPVKMKQTNNMKAAKEIIRYSFVLQFGKNKYNMDEMVEKLNKMAMFDVPHTLDDALAFETNDSANIIHGEVSELATKVVEFIKKVVQGLKNGSYIKETK